MDRPISDNKALQLQRVSTLIKRGYGLGQADSPRWTEALEKTLSELGLARLEHMEYLLTCLTSLDASKPA